MDIKGRHRLHLLRPLPPPTTPRHGSPYSPSAQHSRHIPRCVSPRSWIHRGKSVSRDVHAFQLATPSPQASSSPLCQSLRQFLFPFSTVRGPDLPFAQDPLVAHPISPSCARTGEPSDARYSNAPMSFRHSQASPTGPPSSEAVVRPPPHHDSSSRHLTSPKCPPSYSFNVLRADPITASLEHVASSTTLRHRGATTNSPTSQAGVTNGSAPAFRVSMAPLDQRSSQRHKIAVQPVMRSTRNPSSPTAAREPDLPLHMRSPHSSMLSFSVSDPPSSASTIMTHDGRRSYLRSSEAISPSLSGEGRGKKHQCPHCGKRFNRPSSMKIHVNTHTGAKREYPPFVLIFIITLLGCALEPHCITSDQEYGNSPLLVFR